MARELLQRAVQQASRAGTKQSRLVEGVRWLLATTCIPPELIMVDTPALVNVPNVPYAIKALLVTAGLRVDYQQLASAARRQLTGFHQWGAVEKEQQVPTGLPVAAEVICCIGTRHYDYLPDLMVSAQERTRHAMQCTTPVTSLVSRSFKPSMYFTGS